MQVNLVGFNETPIKITMREKVKWNEFGAPRMHTDGALQTMHVNVDCS